MMRHRVTLENRVVSGTDASGEPVYSWREAERGTLWARVEPITSGERRLANQTGHATTHRITTRFHGKITPSSRFVYRGRVFNVDSIRNLDERDDMLELTAVEIYGEPE